MFGLRVYTDNQFFTMFFNLFTSLGHFLTGTVTHRYKCYSIVAVQYSDRRK